MYSAQWYHSVLRARDGEKGYKSTWCKACIHVMKRKEYKVKYCAQAAYSMRKQKGGKTCMA